MALSSTQQQTFEKWLNKHNSNYKCPCCGDKNFGLGEIIAPPTFSNGTINMGGNTLAMLQLVCNTCAHVTIFASVPIGL
ncbi:MAG: hypothetical protein K9H41_09990 [Bacteroidia bacterium]|nr:hypothetical protein [Bacteroidia bacterium]